MSSPTSRSVRAWLPTGALAAICYIPLLLTHPGQVGADTKSYLYLDPGRLLDRAWSMWDTNVGLGTVTHQNIGYLWPMGPWFWTFERLGIPDWVAQRFWLGSILFLAGLGVRYLMRTLGQQGSQVAVAMFIYGLSPYVLTLAARISALLLPFVGLPWMIGLIIRATRERSWLHPALFALLVPTIGSTNATALFLAGLGPLLWLPFAVFVLGEITIRQALAVVGRIGVLTIGTSLWWIAGLYSQGAYGIDVLRYTETAKTVADPSTSPELLRGLGYWFFYGDDKLGPWIEPSVPYTQNIGLIVATYLLACIGMAAAGFVRWRYRAYFVSLVLVGLVAGVGAHPWDDAPVWGKGVKAFLLSDVGLAMRSLPRSVPLLTLGLAVLAGMGVSALAAWSRRLARPLAAGTIVLAVLCLPPLWTGKMVANNLQRPEDIPTYWTEAAAYLDSQSRRGDGWTTRVLEVPGSDFASYRWGNTVDPITPGIMDRPYVARELIPYGTPVSADVLNALDRQLQEGVLEPEAIAPMARFMAVGSIALRGDLQYERFNLARPRQLWQLLGSAPGLGPAKGFGGNAPNVPDPTLPLNDELELASPPTLADPPKVSVFPVTDPQPIFRTVPATAPVIMAGNGDGLVNASGAGLLSGSELVLYSGSLAGADNRKALDAAIDQPESTLLVTDTNRRAATRWGTVHENNGYTEVPGETHLAEDLGDNRLPLFPAATDDSFTVAQQRGGVQARATAYGNPVTYTPENRAANAIDDDLRTAWTVGGFSAVEHERIDLTYTTPRRTDAVTLTQADLGVQNRWITKARLRFDDGAPLDVELGEASRRPGGQTITFPRRSFSKLSIEITGDDAGHRDRYDNLSAVGFADIRLADGDQRLDEVIRLPKDLLAVAGRRSAAHPLAILLTRLRSRPTSALRDDQELSIVRTFSLPTARAFTIKGQARLSSRVPGTTIDQLIGVTDAAGRPIRATSSRRLPGDIQARATSAIDGDPGTHFSPGFLDQRGDFVSYDLAAPITFDHMDLRVLNDGRHSVPTRIFIEADGKVAAGIDVPAVADQATKNGSVSIPLRFSPVTGKRIRVAIEQVREVKTNDWISKDPVVMPVGIAELGIPGLHAEVPSGAFDSGCRSDLVTIDGKAVRAEVTGTVAAAVAGDPLSVRTCSTSADPTLLRAGNHVVRTRPGKSSGIDIDRLLLTSDSSAGRPVPTAATPPAAAPRITVVRDRRDSASVEIAARPTATWFVLGESHSLGWKATIDGTDLGPATPVNGYANGWLIPAGSKPVRIELTWAPQRIVWAALIASFVSVLGCIALAVVALRRRRRRRAEVPHAAPSGDQPSAFVPSVLWRSSGAPPSIRATALTTAVATLVAAAVIGPVAGLVVGLCAMGALHWRRARALTVLGPVVTLGASGLFTALSQFRNDLPAGFEWPSYFGEVHQVAYVGVALLAVDLVVDRLWTGRWATRSAADHATGEGTR